MSSGYIRKALLIPLIAFFFLISSCESPCGKAQLQFGLIGFSDAESDTIILRRFSKTETPALIDTVLLDNIVFHRYQDTLKMNIFPGSALLESNYNYEILFPAAGKLIALNDIREEQRYDNPRGKVLCINNINGYTLNGQVISNIVPSNTTYFTR